MLATSLFRVGYLFTSSISYQARGFAHKLVVPNQVSQYFLRAKLIDSIRFSLRSESPDSLLPLLDNPNLDSFVVTNALRSAPSPESALSFVEALKRVPTFSHTHHTLRAIAKILSKSGRIGQLKKLIEAINAGKFMKVPPVSYLDRMRFYAGAGDIDSVLCVWDEFQAQGVHPCVECYNILMGLYVQMGKDLEAVQVFRNMMQKGVVLNPRTFTIVVEHLLSSGKVDAGKEIFEILPLMRVKRTLRQYSNMVRVFTNLERFDVVKRIVKEMRMEGVLPPRSMLSSLQRMQDAGFFEETNEFLREMVPDDRIKKIENHIIDEDEENGDDHDSDAIHVVQLKPWLDPSALASALQHWSPEDVSSLEDAKLVWTSRLVCKIIKHFKSPQTAWNFFCWVASQPGFVHDVHTYSGFIRKLVSRGKVDLVDRILSKVKNEGMKLGFSTVKTIIDFYGLFREGDAALRIFHDVKLLCGHLSESERLVLYSSVLRTLIKCGRDHDTLNMMNKMFSLGIYPDVQTFSGLMHHFAVKNDLRTLQKLFGMLRQCGVEPDAYMYRTLIHTYCNSGKATLALRLFEEMRSSKLILDRMTKMLLVKSLWKEGRLKEASTVDEVCKEIDDVLPVPSAGNLFNISSADLIRVYNIYCDNFQASSG